MNPENTSSPRAARSAYLDNIRQSTVILVMVYHVCFLFNGVGVLGGIPGAKNIPAFDAVNYIVYPWFMALLFIVAGMSARYSLQTRSGGEFLKERTVKLLVPSTLGLFVIHWITGYLNIRIGGGLAYIPAPLVYPISVLSGIGPLWFLHMLFLFSCLLLLLRKPDPKDRVWNFFQNTDIRVVSLLFLVFWGASQVLNVPVLTMYRFGIYLAAFLIGYYIFSHEEVLDRIEAVRIPALVLSLCGAVLYTFCYYGSDYTSPACLQSLATSLYAWAVILAVFGCFRHYFNRESAYTRYMRRAGFGWYVLHYPMLMTVSYLLCFRLNLPVTAIYVLALAGEFVLTFALYGIVRRIPGVRYLVLGIRSCSRRTGQNPDGARS